LRTASDDAARRPPSSACRGPAVKGPISREPRQPLTCDPWNISNAIQEQGKALGSAHACHGCRDRRHRRIGAARCRHRIRIDAGADRRRAARDGSKRSASTTLAYLRVACRIGPQLKLAADAFNLFDRKGSDIDYFYASRLRGEPPGGVDDIHSHPVEPRTLRVTLTASF
jgi:hypothetical protein